MCDQVGLDDGNQLVTLASVGVWLQGHIRAVELSELLGRLPFGTNSAVALFSGAFATTMEIYTLCPVGVATLAAVLWLLRPSKMILELGDEDNFMALAMNTIGLALESAAWLKGSADWPFCAVMARLANHLSDVLPDPKGQGLPPSWDVWLTSASWEPPLQHVYATGKGGGSCEVATVGNKILEGMRLAGAADIIVQCVIEAGVTPLLTRRWVRLWQGLDRLGTHREVDVKVGRTGFAFTPFRMRLMPPYISSVTEWDWMGDRIRAHRQGHCSPSFQAMVEDVVGTWRMGLPPKVIVEIGSHHGECCLWAAARFGGERIRCHAVEINVHYAAVAHRSVMLNGFNGTMQVHNRRISPPAPCTGTWPSIGAERARWKADVTKDISLDCFFRQHAIAHVDIVHMSTGNCKVKSKPFALQFIAGLKETFDARRLSYCLVRAVCMPVAEFSEALPAYAIHGKVYGINDDKDAVIEPL